MKLNPDDPSQVHRWAPHISMNKDGFIPHGTDPSARHLPRRIGKKKRNGIVIGEWIGYFRMPRKPTTVTVDWGDGERRKLSPEGLLAVDVEFDLGPCELPHYHQGPCEPGGDAS